MTPRAGMLSGRLGSHRFRECKRRQRSPAPADRSGRIIEGRVVRGEHKNIPTNRVVLVPGPAEEVATVGWIYRSFVEARLSEREIADALNDRGILTISAWVPAIHVEPKIA